MPDRKISRAEVLKAFEPYGCRLVVAVPPFELWETGWQEPFTLQPEADGYDEWQVNRVIRYVIQKTIPPGWPRPGG